MYPNFNKVTVYCGILNGTFCKIVEVNKSGMKACFQLKIPEKVQIILTFSQILSICERHLKSAKSLLIL